MTERQEPTDRRITRRALLGAGAAGGLAVVAGGIALERSGDGQAAEPAAIVPFYGEHQAGIATPAQDRLFFAAFDMTSTKRSDLRDLLRTWTTAAALMTRGRFAGPQNTAPLLPPDDTGEALGIGPSSLTITIGLGPSLFDERFGLAAGKPAALRELPPLPGDELDRDLCGGDLCVQACANDPTVAFHAVHDLTRMAYGVAVMRWCQLGFGRTSSTTKSQETPRNLMGFKDGTNNLDGDDPAQMRRYVWAGREAPRWMRGGTYLVSRRIRMVIETWDRTSLQEQERTFGREKYSGAPLGQQHEHDPVDLKISKPDGDPVIDRQAHIRLAAASTNDGTRLLRRGYSFTDGFDPVRGQLDAGLFFICFQRDPIRQFARLQTKLGLHDALNEYILHTSSAVFAVPPGVRPGGYIGEGLV